jgi:5,6-dimethylbenzimidazole synthase
MTLNFHSRGAVIYGNPKKSDRRESRNPDTLAVMTERNAPVFDDLFCVQFENLLRWRRDVRRFKRDPIAPELLDRLLKMASLAPSVGLSEPWRLATVDDPARREAVRRNFEDCNAEALTACETERQARYARLKLSGLDEAPCQLALFVEPSPEQGHGLGRRTMQETVAYSAVMAAHTLWLAARVFGVGVGWVSILDPTRVVAALDAPSHWRFIGYFCLGYPAAEDDTPDLERRGWERRRADISLLRR